MENAVECETSYIGFALSKVQRPTKHIVGHIGDGFLRVKWPNNSVKALKEGPKD